MEKSKRIRPGVVRRRKQNAIEIIFSPDPISIFLALFVSALVLISLPCPAAAADDSTQTLISEMKQDLYAIADSATDNETRWRIAIYFIRDGSCERALNLADRIDSGGYRQLLFYRAAEEFAEYPDHRWLDTLLTRGLRTESSAGPSIYRGDILERIAYYAPSLENTQRAQSLLTGAIRAADSLESYYDRARVLGQAAASELAIGDTAQCISLMQETLKYVAEFYGHYEGELSLISGHTRGTPAREYFDGGRILYGVAATAIKLDNSNLGDSLLSSLMQIGKDDRTPYPFASDAGWFFTSLLDLFRSPQDSLRADNHIKSLALYAMQVLGSGYSSELIDSMTSQLVSRSGTAGLASFLKTALDRSDSLGDRPERVLLLSAIPRVAVRLDDSALIKSMLAQAVRRANEMSQPLYKSWTLERIARELINLNIDAGVDSLLWSAAAASDGIVQPGDRAQLLQAVAYSAEKLGDTALADTVFILTGGCKAPLFEHRFTSTKLQETTSQLTDHGDTALADSIIPLARRAMNNCRMFELINTAGRLLEHGDIARADSVTLFSIVAMEKCQSYSIRYVYVKDIANTIMRFDNSERRRALMASLSRAVDAMDDARTRSGGYCSMADYFLKRDRTRQGDSLLRLAVSAADAIDGSDDKAEALSEIAIRTAQLRDSRKEGSLWALLRKAAEGIPDTRYRVETLTGMADTALGAGRKKAGEMLLRSALHTAETANLNDTTERHPAAIADLVQVIADRCDSASSDSILSAWLDAAAGIDTTDQYRTSIMRCVYEESKDDFFGEPRTDLFPLLIRESENSRDAWGAAGVLLDIAFDERISDDTTLVITLARKALEISRRTPSDDNRAWFAGSIAFLAGSMGQVRMAYDAVYTIKSPRYRVDPLLSALKGYEEYLSKRNSTNDK